MGEFRALWLAMGVSATGSQLTRVALSLLAYGATGSTLVGAAALVAAYVPDVLIGPALAWVADTYPRRRVMVATDLGQCAVVAVMALPGMPLWTVLVLAVVAACASAPAAAARTASVAVILPAPAYPTGQAMVQATAQLAQVLGTPLAALVVAAVGARSALWVDAATFAFSATVSASRIRPRPAAATRGGVAAAPGQGRRGAARHVAAAARVVAGTPRLRTSLVLACLTAVALVPEGLAAAYGHAVAAGVLAVGWLWVTLPAGAVMGMTVLTRLAPARRRRLVGPLAVGAGLALVPTAWSPPVGPTAVGWLACGLCTSYVAVVQATYVAAVPDRLRAQAIGLAQAALRGSYAVALLTAGAVARMTGPGPVIGATGALGVILAAVSWWRWHHAQATLEHPGQHPPTAAQPGATALPG